MNLTANFNRKSDSAAHPEENMALLMKPDQYATTAEWVTDLYNKTKQYKYETEVDGKKIDYDLFPKVGASSRINNGYNSNSFVNGLLNATHTQMPNPSTLFPGEVHPGWDKPVPPDLFLPDQ